MSKSIAEQLKPIKKNFSPRNKFKSEVDGIHHINIYRDGKTELGRLLAFEHESRFEHPILGVFNSMTGYWSYVKSVSHREAYRVKSPNLCISMRKRSNDLKQKVDNFQALILAGCYARIISDEHLVEMVKESTLPFEMYYIRKEVDDSTGTPIKYEIKTQHTYTHWLTAGFEEIRNALREGRGPDLMPFVDTPNVPLYKDFISENSIVVDTEGYGEQAPEMEDEIPEDAGAEELNPDAGKLDALVDNETVEMEGVTPDSSVLNKE